MLIFSQASEHEKETTRSRAQLKGRAIKWRPTWCDPSGHTCSSLWVVSSSQMRRSIKHQTAISLTAGPCNAPGLHHLQRNLTPVVLRLFTKSRLSQGSSLAIARLERLAKLQLKRRFAKSLQWKLNSHFEYLGHKQIDLIQDEH